MTGAQDLVALGHRRVGGEVVTASSKKPMAPLERQTTGSETLDHILGGGLPIRSINMIAGEPGSGKTVLTDATYRRRYGLMRLALGAGADPNLFSSDDYGEWMPIAHAVRAGWRPAVELLLKRGADPNGRSCPRAGAREKPTPHGCQRQTGLTPMMLAAAGGQGYLAHVLGNYGADRNAVDWLGRTAADHRTGGN